jgi:hypothetical protein
MSTANQHARVTLGHPLSSMLQNEDRELPQYWIPPHVRVCAAVTGTVVLDLKCSRYFGIGVNETRALLTLDASHGQANMLVPSPLEPMTRASAAHIAPALVNAGLLSREPPGIDPLPRTPVELGGTLTTVQHPRKHPNRLRPIDAIYFVRSCKWARRAARVQMFDVACEIAHFRSLASNPFDMGQAIDRVSLFRRLRPFAFAAEDQCLFHALALWKFLSRYGLRATWVIGVRPRPWAAHSWVQLGDVLLDADPEHVYEYIPILAV